MKDTLLKLGPQRVYEGRNLEQIMFPIGGIGTGCVGLSGYGMLQEWSIFNRPNIGTSLENTFPLIWARERGKEPVCRVVGGPPAPPYMSGGGQDPKIVGDGFPHMDSNTFRGEYPFAWVDFACRDLPVEISLEAYNPFIPNEPVDSGFPAAILKYTVKNTRRSSVRVSLAWIVQNAVGSIGQADRDKVLGHVEFGYGKNVNAYIERDGLRGVLMTSRKWKKSHPRFGSMAIATDAKHVTVMRYWTDQGGFAPRHELWDRFSATGELPDHEFTATQDLHTSPGGLGARARLKPGESRELRFYISWYFPNFEKYWHEMGAHVKALQACQCPPVRKLPVWKNYYARQFDDAFDVAVKLHKREDELCEKTKAYHTALFSSTLPPYVLDAISSTVSTLKSPTCLRLTDGAFYAFEGSSNAGGCCEGSCTHVWNYQQALPFLFPSLERSMREMDYRHNMAPDGQMVFRLALPPGGLQEHTFKPCPDGQLGGIVKMYRDWKISGDDDWLRRLWPRVRKALEYAWEIWDPEKSGVVTGVQHNTYDIEFYGANPMIACFYLSALQAGAELAEYLGESRRAVEYRQILERGRAWIEENLYNGDYYVQEYDPVEAPVHQYGTGCLSDQLLGQWLGQISGLGYVLDQRRVRKTLRSTFRFNFQKDVRAHANAQRVYALQGEGGLLLCSWPRGGRPAVPFIYSDEIWTGIEYQVASHCILEDLIDEGLTIVRTARERYDGLKRNPWDEYECGHHYARAMSSYGLLLALSGFEYDKGAGLLGFAPRIHQHAFRCFWSIDGAWGTYHQDRHSATVTVCHGEYALKRLNLRCVSDRRKCVVRFGRKKTVTTFAPGGGICFASPIHLRPGSNLSIAF